MTTVTLGSLMSIGTTSWSPAEENMYLEIIKVWYQMFTRLERRRHPLGPYVIGEGFIESVANASVDRYTLRPPVPELFIFRHR